MRHPAGGCYHNYTKKRGKGVVSFACFAAVRGDNSVYAMQLLVRPSFAFARFGSVPLASVLCVCTHSCTRVFISLCLRHTETLNRRTFRCEVRLCPFRRICPSRAKVKEKKTPHNLVFLCFVLIYIRVLPLPTSAEFRKSSSSNEPKKPGEKGPKFPSWVFCSVSFAQHHLKWK